MSNKERTNNEVSRLAAQERRFAGRRAELEAQGWELVTVTEDGVREGERERFVRPGYFSLPGAFVRTASEREWERWTEEGCGGVLRRGV